MIGTIVLGLVAMLAICALRREQGRRRRAENSLIVAAHWITLGLHKRSQGGES